ncbi:mesJ [Wigglesworthia glossinidia endosymbiont of Glossina brevipalpis]|uniref:tRNA(Ile)-lysidine synthase n=1 Tax=Wigglesworthia glossinidia brevipalpis TaxID=36870 RepID=TILS_WIGBR|nr:RecName: Full=tRNA(Ile)-lysidine synthase; AltName: Full=tRNA(Ile)-2-lysyl-cytidine synthase; AltName: Full=tRNA(Ile)-lysidine synthetase [Wigglesworthia glossinidia endosymbiont of Glossina brevipalpis]BAC24545.1 mesJ [Wigglesworthia glossinidia endosymbiont of Glossina brevipalpis]
MLKKFFKEISYKKSYVLAFSGGLDSTVLLHMISLYIKKIKNNNNFFKKIFKFRAVYINHNICKESKYWSNHCHDQCLKYKVFFKSINIFISDFSEGIESSARRERYKALFSDLNPEEVLITAHHQDDQIETILLSLKRGSGPRGISGMQSIKKFDSHIIKRPLLHCKKEDIKLYAIKHNLNWIDDKSNLNIKFDRNFLRSEIIPLLKKRWPNIGNTISRSAKLCFDQEKLLNELLKDTLNSLVEKDKSLKFIELFKMSEIKRFAILRKWFCLNNFKMPSLSQLKHIWKNVIISKKDSKAEIKINNNIIKRFKKNLYFIPIYSKNHLKNIIFKTSLNHSKKIVLPYDLGTLITKPIMINENFIKKINFFYYNNKKKFIFLINLNYMKKMSFTVKLWILFIC